jgi:hypothetical protein
VVFHLGSQIGLATISLGYLHHEPSFKRTNQLDIPVSVDVV